MNKDKQRVLDFLRGEFPTEDLESELLGELASVAREEYVSISTTNLELAEKVTSLEGEVKDLTEKLEKADADKEEATNRVKEFEELEKTRVSDKKETLLALIKEEITQLGLAIPEKDDEDSILDDLNSCGLETIEQIHKLLTVAEPTDLAGLQQTKPEGESEEDDDSETSEDDEEETNPGDALPDNNGSEEPKKPHELLDRIYALVGDPQQGD